MERAAINVIGATGEIYDFVPSSAGHVTCSRESVGVYNIKGTLGMVPFPPENVGWGYTVNQVDRNADVEIKFKGKTLSVSVSLDGEPYDLKHMITLHVMIPSQEIVAPVLPTGDGGYIPPGM